MITEYPRGSEWRRWDLHVHTPGTYLNNQYTNIYNIKDRIRKIKRPAKNERTPVLAGALPILNIEE